VFCNPPPAVSRLETHNTCIQSTIGIELRISIGVSTTAGMLFGSLEGNYLYYII
jgi:hypothetical protein